MSDLKEMHQQINTLKDSEVGRKGTENVLNKVKCAYQVLRQCNKVLMTSIDDKVFLEEMCRIIVEEGGYRSAWVGYAEQDKEEEVIPIAQVGCEKGYLDTVNIKWADTERGRGPAETAIRTGKVSINKNMLTDPKYAPWRSEATKRGYASSIALPLKDKGQVFGALNIYSKVPDAFDSDEQKLLIDLADDLSFGIVTLKKQIELKRAETDLLLQRAITTNMAEGAYVIRTSDSTIMYANPMFEKMFGYGPDEIVGKHISIVNAPTDKTPEETACEIIGSLERDGVWSGDVKNIKKDRTLFWCYANVSTFDHPEYGEVWISIHTDITERKQAENDKKESEQRLQSIIDNSTTVIFVKDLGGRYLLINRCYEHLFNIDRASIKGKTDYEVFPKDMADAFRKNDHAVIESKKPIEFEEIVPHEDGLHTYIAIKFPLFNSAGEIHAICGIATDITERKQVEDSLKESEQLLSKAQEIAHIGHWKLNPDTNEVTGSNELYRIFGLRREESTFESFIEVVHPEDREFDVATIRRGIEHGEDWNIEHRLICKDGTQKWTQSVGEAITDETGKVVLLVGTAQDITKRKKGEKALLQRTEELNKLTMEMTRIEERERRKFAEILHEGIGQNLVAIKMFCENFGMTIKNKDADTEKMISQTLSLLHETIQSTRSMTKDIYPSVLDRFGLVQSIKWYANTFMKSKDLKISLDIDKTIEDLKDDYKKDTYRIVRECFQNILKHASASKVNLICKREKDILRLTVKDDGVGFEYKENEVASEQGIGLSLMKEWVKNFKGDFNIKTQLGKGTTVIVDLACDKSKIQSEK